MTNYRIGPHRTTWEREQNIQILIIQNGQYEVLELASGRTSHPY